MSSHVPMTVPLPPPPADGLVEPFATTGEVVLLALGALLTVIVAGGTIVFFARQQRREMKARREAGDG